MIGFVIERISKEHCLSLFTGSVSESKGQDLKHLLDIFHNLALLALRHTMARNYCRTGEYVRESSGGIWAVDGRGGEVIEAVLALNLLES